LKLYPSHISLYQQCPLRYKFRYIDRIPEKTSPELFLGSRLHDTLAAFFDIPADKRSLETLKDLFRDTWAGRGLPFGKRRPILRDRYQAFEGDRDREREFGLRGLDMLERFYNTPMLQIQPEHKEEFLELPLIVPGQTDDEWEFDEELILGGKVDRVDSRPDGTLHVIDYKTGRYVPDDEEAVRAEGDMYLSLPIYALLVQQTYKKPVERASLYYLEEGRFIHLELSPEELEDMKDQVIELAAEIMSTETFEPSINVFCPCSYESKCPLQFDDVPF